MPYHAKHHASVLVRKDAQLGDSNMYTIWASERVGRGINPSLFIIITDPLRGSTSYLTLVTKLRSIALRFSLAWCFASFGISDACSCFCISMYLLFPFRTGGILWTSLRRRYGISIGISDSIGEMVCRGQKSILSCWRPNIDVSSHGLMCHESVYRSSYIRCWRILIGFRCSEYSDERKDYLYGVGENQPSVVYHQSNACCIQ